MSKREATHRVEETQSSRNVRHRPNPPPKSFDKRVLRILKGHPCRNNTRDNKCIDSNNPFGFRYRDSSKCMDFSKDFYPYQYRETLNIGTETRNFLYLGTESDFVTRVCSEKRIRDRGSHFLGPVFPEQKALALRRNNEMFELNHELLRAQHEALSELNLPVIESATYLPDEVKNMIMDYASFTNDDYKRVPKDKLYQANDSFPSRFARLP